jgi:hypothetical protein
MISKSHIIVSCFDTHFDTIERCTDFKDYLHAYPIDNIVLYQMLLELCDCAITNDVTPDNTQERLQKMSMNDIVYSLLDFNARVHCQLRCVASFFQSLIDIVLMHLALRVVLIQEKTKDQLYYVNKLVKEKKALETIIKNRE